MTATVPEVLAEAQHLGFIGGAPLDAHVAHALDIAVVLERAPEPRRVVDLGAGGGLPGLVLAERWPSTIWWLVEANQRRCAFLEAAVDRLGWPGRVQVVRGRAEEVARQPELRGAMDLVVARSFGPPAVTAECASGFLAVGGRLAVSEPPDPSDDGPAEADPRWPAEGLAQLGLVLVGPPVAGPGNDAHVQILEQAQACPDRYPRRVGIPAKRPLF